MATITRPHEVGKPVICGSKQATKTFIPYKRFNGKNGQSVAFCIPKVLVRYPGLSWGAKACWGALALRAGEKGLCIPSQTTIADDMGTSVRSVRNYLEELGAKGFIHRVSRYNKNGRTSDGYEFIEHEIFVPWYRQNSATTPRQNSATTGTSRTLPRKRIRRQRSLKENTAKGEEQSAQVQHCAPSDIAKPETPKPIPSRKSDDDKPKTENPPRKTKTETPAYASALDELVALMTQQLGRPPDAKLLRVVCDNAELGGHTMRDFVDDIRPRIGRLKTRAGEGFFVSQAQGFGGIEQSPAPAPRLAGESIPAKTAKCARCKWGYLDDGSHCDCKLGRDLKLMDEKATRALPGREPSRAARAATR